MKKNALAVICLIITVLFAVYSIHIDYPLPFHSEEYDHLNLAKETVQEKKILIGLNWETGFSVLLGTINSLLLNSLDNNLIFIPIIFGLIMALSSFVLGRYLFKSSLAGLLFGLFSLMIPSNPAVMGLWFAVPNSMVLALTPMLIYLFLKGTTNKKTAFIFILLFAFSTIVHPAFTLLLIPIMAVYLLISPQFFQKNQLKIAIAIIALILVFPFFASRLGVEKIAFNQESIPVLSKNITELLVWESITQYNPKFYLADFLGYYALFLAGIGTGAIILMRILIEIKRRVGKKSVIEKDFIVSRHQIILPIAVIVLGFLYIHFNLKGYTFIAPYERMFLSLMLFLLMTAAAGTFILWKIINKKLQEYSKPFSVAFIAVILFFLLTIPFTQKTELYKNIETTGISSIKWIEEFTPKKSSFIALPKNSLAIRSFTERTVFASPPTRAGIPDDFQLESFFIQDCTTKTETIQKTKAQYIFGEKEILCTNINKIYDKKDYKIFKTSNA